MSNIIEYNGRQFAVGSYAVSKALESLEIPLSDIGVAIQTKLFPLVSSLIYHACAYPFIKKGQLPDFSETDVYDWIDESGGWQSKFISEIQTAMISSLSMGDSQPEVDSTNTGEKKNRSVSRKTA